MAYNKKLPHKRGYPGAGYYYVICDVCGLKLRAKDAILITDKYNLLKNMLVCRQDVDKTNPQQYIKARRERQIDNPRLIRSEGEDTFKFTSDADDIDSGGSSSIGSRSPGVPRYLSIFSGAAAATELQWIGPESPGSDVIHGYKIERESPVGGGFSTLTANTASVASYYKDTTTNASTQYNYRVSAISDVGTGSPSNEANTTTTA